MYCTSNPSVASTVGLLYCPYSLVVKLSEVSLTCTKAILFPTKYGEGLSRVVMESIYLGIPLLVSRNQGTEEILPYDYKYFLKSNNPSSVAEQLNELILDKEYYEKTLLIQKDKLKRMYSIKASINEFFKLIK